MGLRGWEFGVILNKIADSIIVFNIKKWYESNYIRKMAKR